MIDGNSSPDPDHGASPRYRHLGITGREPLDGVSPSSRMGSYGVRQDEPQDYLSRAAGLISHAANRGVSILSRAVSITLVPVHWMIENRFGAAKLTGLLAFPSQCLSLFGCGPTLEQSNAIVNAACCSTRGGFRTEKIVIEHDSVKLNAVICYPPGWDPQDKSHCILYHNPNGIVLSQYLFLNRLGYNEAADVWTDPTHTPGNLQRLKNCPVILYDYRGTGINHDPGLAGYLPFSTCETVARDGLAATRFAFDNYHSVETIGSSFGGVVALEGLSRYRDMAGDCFDSDRVRLVSHDAFTTSPRVMMPGSPWLADTLGWLAGGYMGAERSMRKLIDRNVKMRVLNHVNDRVIPKGARLSEFAKAIGREDIVLESQSAGAGNLSHAVLTEDMKAVI